MYLLKNQMRHTKINYCLLSLVFFLLPSTIHAFIFTGTVFNNVPWVLSLSKTGVLYNAHFVHGNAPPQLIEFKGYYSIEAEYGFTLSGLTYTVANEPVTASTPFMHGCQILSLNVNSFHQVSMIVIPVYPAGEAPRITCTCQATEGQNPSATLIINEGSNAAPYTCKSS